MHRKVFHLSKRIATCDCFQGKPAPGLNREVLPDQFSPISTRTEALSVVAGRDRAAHPDRGMPGDRRAQLGHGADRRLVGMDPGGAEPQGITDADMHMVPPGQRTCPPPSAEGRDRSNSASPRFLCPAFL